MFGLIDHNLLYTNKQLFIEDLERGILSGTHPVERDRLAEASLNLTRLSSTTGYVRSEFRYVGVRGQPQPLRYSIKQL